MTGDLTLRAALDALPAGLAVYAPDGQILYANPATWRQAGPDVPPLPPGATRDDLIGLMARAGHYGPGDPERRIADRRRLDGDQPLRRVAQDVAGRWHALTSQPIPGGGAVSLSVDVTDVHRSDSAAAARAGTLEALLERLANGVAEYDREDRLRYFNPAYGTLIGAPPGGLRLGMTVAEVFDLLEASGQYAGVDADWIAALPRGGLRGPQEATRRRPDGGTFWTRVRPLPEGGHLLETTDITALRRAEEAAAERAAVLEGVLAAMPHGVCVYGPDGRVAMVNAAYQRIMQGTEIAVGDRHDAITERRIAAGEYGAEPPEAVRSALRDFQVPLDSDRVRTRPNGTTVSVRAARLPDQGVVTVLTDVTALHRAEAEARRQAATLRDMLENQRDGVALFGADGLLLACNALAPRMLGMPEDEMVPGRSVADLRARQLSTPEFHALPEQDRAFLLARQGQHVSMNERYVRRRADGGLMEVRTDPTPGGGFIRTFRDVTEEHRVRAELEAARDAAEAASRAKSRFLATMTHELRTPLHAVIGFAEAIRDEARPEVMRAHAQEVQEAGRALLDLVEGILDASRAEAGVAGAEGVPFDPAPVLRASVAEALTAAEAAGLTLDMDIPRRLPHLRGQPVRLGRAMDALLSNAVKFTPSGGHVRVEAEAREGEPTVVRVADTGIGMDPADIPRAFEAFVQLESGLARRYAGSGLGLYLARAAADSMGIGLSLQSAPGRGTVARLELPVLSQEGS